MFLTLDLKPVEKFLHVAAWLPASTDGQQLWHSASTVSSKTLKSCECSGISFTAISLWSVYNGNTVATKILLSPSELFFFLH